MNKWIRFSMKNTGVIFLVMIIILAGGWYSTSTMKLEQFPNIDIPYLTVIVPYPGASPEQSLEDVGKPIEQAMSGIKGLKNTYLTAAGDYVVATSEFDMDQSMSEVEKDLNSALASVKLPDGAKKPQISKQGPTAAPIYSFAITANSDQATIQQYINEHIKPLFSTVQGISSIDVNGSSEKKIFIKVDPDKLKTENLSLDKVKQALMANNLIIPAGQVTIDGKSMNVEAGKKIQSEADFKNINLILVDQDMSGLTNAFGLFGSAVGNLTKGQMIMQGEIQLMQGISGITSALMADKEALATNPTDPVLKLKVKREEEKITALQIQLAYLQQQATAAGISLTSGLASAGNSSNGVKPSLKIRNLLLSDIADISYGSGKDTTITRLNGKPAVVTDIKTQPGTNTVEIVKEINEKLGKLDLPKGYQLTKLRDTSIQIKSSVDGMLREVLLGSLFAVIVTFLFLRNIRATIVSILSIPLSIFASMITMKWLNYSLNIMTLAGMAVAVGRVVDDSIVVIENIYRRVRISPERNSDLVLEATKEVGQAVTSSTITTIAVFGPLSFVPGIVGKFFAPFGITVVIALAFSLVVAISVVPLLSRLFLLNIEQREHKETALQHGYRKVLGWSLEHKLAIAIIALALVAGSFAMISKIPQNFLPSEKTVSYGLQVNLPIGSATSTSNEVAKKVETNLEARKDLKSYQTSIKGNTIYIQLELIDNVAKEDTKKFEKEIQKISTVLGPDIRLALSPQGSIVSGGGLSLVVNGSDLESIKKAGSEIVRAIKGIPGLADVDTNLESVKPQISIDIDNKAAADRGLNSAMIGSAVRDMIDGNTVLNVTIDGRNTDVNLGLKVDDLKNIDIIRQQKITNMTGDQIQLSDVATVTQKPGPSSIRRLNQQEYVMVTGRFTTDNSAKVQKDIDLKVANLKLPKGVTYYYEGETKAMGDGFKNLIIAMGIAILLVYIVMLIAFGEMLAPMSILFSLPFIFVGGLLGLIVTKESLGMPALVGFLMLIGIVVTNAIVLVDRVLQNRNNGMESRQALIEAGVTRIRPILMTAVATIGALLPLAISSEGGLISKSLAIVVISGLTTSTILTLIIVPVAYQVLDTIRSKVFSKFANNVAQ